MIYINGKELDFSNEAKDYEFRDLVDDYNAYIDALKGRHGDYITYITRQRPRRDAKTGNLRPVPLKSWPKIQSGIRIEVRGKDRPRGPYSIVWDKQQVLVKDNIPQLEEKNFLVKEGQLSIDLKTNGDFAWFLQYHNVVRTGEFFIYDPAKTAHDKADRYRKEQKVRDLLFSEYSPLNKDESKLHAVARRWGIGQLDRLTRDQIAVELFEKVIGNEEAMKKNPNLRGVQEFLSDTNLGASVRAGELVSLAKEQGILKFNKTHSEYQLIFPGRTQGTPYFSIPAEKIHTMDDYLIDSLVIDDQLMRKLESALGVEDERKEVAFEIDKLEDYGFKELQTIAASMGIKAIGIKKEQLKQDIIEAYQSTV